MSLDNKRGEIAKLERRVWQREEALRVRRLGIWGAVRPPTAPILQPSLAAHRHTPQQASEAALDADAKRFDEFLKENDARLQESLRRAETEARARQEKGTEAKRLVAANTRARADVAKAEEALGEARRCAEFLDRVTPEAHFAALEAKRETAKEALRTEWRADYEALARRRAEAAAAKAAAERDMQWARTQQQYERAEAAARTAAAALREAAAMPEPPPPDLAAVDAQEAPLFFEEPTQLLAVFSQLEGRNLFLIQASGASSAGMHGTWLIIRDGTSLAVHNLNSNSLTGYTRCRSCT